MIITFVHRLGPDDGASNLWYHCHFLLIPCPQIADGARSSSARDFIAPALSRPNLDVVVNTHVTKIVQTGTQDGLPVFLGVNFARNASSKRVPCLSTFD